MKARGHILEMPDFLKQFGSINQHYLWASLIWGSVASGYLIYGWKQRSLIPFVAGLVMTTVSIFIFSALLMSLVCVATIFATWWLLKQGY